MKRFLVKATTTFRPYNLFLSSNDFVNAPAKLSANAATYYYHSGWQRFSYYSSESNPPSTENDSTASKTITPQYKLDDFVALAKSLSTEDLKKIMRYYFDKGSNEALPKIDPETRKLLKTHESDQTENGSTGSEPPSAKVKLAEFAAQAKDVSTEELKEMIASYLTEGTDAALPGIFEAIVARKLLKTHEKSDDELCDSLDDEHVPQYEDEDVESDFEKLPTDDEFENLYDTRTRVDKKMMEDKFYNMDDKKWDSMINDAIQSGEIKDTKECEEILEDMLHWNHLLPEDVKKSVTMKLDEIEGKYERGEIDLEQAQAMYQKFEDKIVKRCGEGTQAGLTHASSTNLVSNQAGKPPGEGPILRWETRVVFAPGGDAWHPKNRKVKLFVTVKDIGLSKNQFRRLRELVGKRYDCGRDELTITSERFEHREENRKDCLRTLFGLIEEAGKGDKLAEEARVAYVKQRLKANPAFMERLRSKLSSVSI